MKCNAKVTVEPKMRLVGSGSQVGLVLQAAAQEVRQHRLDEHHVCELCVRGSQAHRDGLADGGGEVDGAQFPNSLVFMEEFLVTLQDRADADDFGEGSEQEE